MGSLFWLENALFLVARSLLAILASGVALVTIRPRPAKPTITSSKYTPSGMAPP